jgi:hypothetical protein
MADVIIFLVAVDGETFNVYSLFMATQTQHYTVHKRKFHRLAVIGEL